MGERSRGLYETLITEALAAELLTLDRRWAAVSANLRSAEAGDRIGLHLGRVIAQAVETLPEDQRVAVGIELARALIAETELRTQADISDQSPVSPGTVLQALLGRLPDGTTEFIARPQIPLLDTTLLTNAPGEPRVGHQLLEEIHSANRIDAVIAFVRRSGIAPFLEAMRRHCEAGHGLRILTTTYTGSTEARALDELLAIGAEVRVSYETSGARLHAKAWLLHRDSGYSTAYVGSSNLTHSAQVTGLEWNVRVSGARNPDVIAKIGAVFDSYWNGGDFLPYDPKQFAAFSESSSRDPEFVLSPLEIRPEPFQERLLEQIAISRLHGHHRNLLVSATGTGKTVMAALDYLRLRQELPRARLLFVAHREELLDQSLATFRHALRTPAFGERWVRGNRPKYFEHVFASIQSLRATGYADFDSRHFDVIIIDEFHHAAAPSYEALLEHVAPLELLGLTATPERSDGLPLLHWFDNRIAAELRLWDAIDQHRLVPFVYYGLHDGMDLRDVPWQRGRGYDIDRLSKLFTSNDVWARKVLAQLARHVDNPRRMRAMGYCVSVDHARFMARVFNDAGIPATAVWGNSPAGDRCAALENLAERKINVVFSVDLFNEGVDIPAVDTLLMLRPTDSPVLFLQQLGRGLRRASGKSVCTILDFVGHHRREFRFDRRFRALLGGSRIDVQRQIASGFPYLPAGCHMELDPVAAEIVLNNIREATPAQWTAKVEELRSIVAKGEPVSLQRFLTDTGLEVGDVYTGNRSWSDLKADAGLPLLPAGPHETTLRRACGRLLHIDDAERLAFYRQALQSEVPPDAAARTERERRLLRMLVASVVGGAVDKQASLGDGANLLWKHPQVRAELLELLDMLAEEVAHLHHSLAGRPDVPLQVHARYTRIEIFAALGIGAGAKVAPWQTGVYWAKEAAADLLAFTLDKTSGNFSPTTRYRDYAISRELIHWESQGRTRANDREGLRYQHHRAQGSSILLFARLRTDERGFWFLGPAMYVSHQSERPMAVTWRLEHPLPPDVYTSFAAAVA